MWDIKFLSLRWLLLCSLNKITADSLFKFDTFVNIVRLYWNVSVTRQWLYIYTCVSCYSYLQEVLNWWANVCESSIVAGYTPAAICFMGYCKSQAPSLHCCIYLESVTKLSHIYICLHLFHYCQRHLKNWKNCAHQGLFDPSIRSVKCFLEAWRSQVRAFGHKSPWEAGGLEEAQQSVPCATVARGSVQTEGPSLSQWFHRATRVVLWMLCVTWYLRYAILGKGSRGSAGEPKFGQQVSLPPSDHRSRFRRSWCQSPPPSGLIVGSRGCQGKN